MTVLVNLMFRKLDKFDGPEGGGGGGRFGMVIELHILGAHIRDGFYTGGRINGI